tara:strand:+ start:173 stop:421 length:249 start_codon:yes stop_codon:yes gene_type:complete
LPFGSSSSTCNLLLRSILEEKQKILKHLGQECATCLGFEVCKRMAYQQIEETRDPKPSNSPFVGLVVCGGTKSFSFMLMGLG